MLWSSEGKTYIRLQADTIELGKPFIELLENNVTLLPNALRKLQNCQKLTFGCYICLSLALKSTIIICSMCSNYSVARTHLQKNEQSACVCVEFLRRSETSRLRLIHVRTW